MPVEITVGEGETMEDDGDGVGRIIATGVKDLAGEEEEEVVVAEPMGTDGLVVDEDDNDDDEEEDDDDDATLPLVVTLVC
jgi:hypothetical protein